MKRIIAAIALFVAATFITTGSALAQDHRAKATVPFNFSVNGSWLPAGNYTIGSDSTSANVLNITDREKSVHILARVGPIRTTQAHPASWFSTNMATSTS